MAHLQIGRDIGDAPLTEPSLAVIGDVGRKPSLQRIALKRMRLIVAAEQRLWRMAGAAMLQTLDEVGAAIPFRGFRQFGSVQDSMLALSPAVTENVPPETILASSDARKTTIGATSSGAIQGTPRGDFDASPFLAVSWSFASSPLGVLPRSRWLGRSGPRGE